MHPPIANPLTRAVVPARTALVTGATGFCGRHLVEALAGQDGWRVIGLGRAAAPPGNHADDYLPVDLRDPGAIERAILRVRPRVVYHLAGTREGGRLHALHVRSTLVLLEALRQHSPGARVVLVGTAAEYGATQGRRLTEDMQCRPCTPFGRTKHEMGALALAWARRHRQPLVVSRPFNVIGPGCPPSLVIGAVRERACRALASGTRTVSVGSLGAVRDFLAVQDVVDGWLRLAHGGAWGEVVNLCSGVPRCVGDVVRSFLSLSPTALALTVDTCAAPPGVALCAGSPEKAARLLGWRARRSLHSSLAEVWRGTPTPYTDSVPAREHAG